MAGSFEPGLPDAAQKCFEWVIEEEDELRDFLIHVKHKSFHVHSYVMSSAVPYFECLFRSGMKESIEKEITFNDMDPRTMKCIIDFAYTDKLKLPNDVLELLDKAVYMGIDYVISECFKFLHGRLYPDNVLIIHNHALTTQNAEMIEETERYIRENFDDVSKSEEFLKLTKDNLKGIIAKDDLCVMTEAVIFEAVMRWVKASKDEHLKYLPELLQSVRMHLLTPDFLDEQVLTEDLIQSSDLCKEIVNAAKMYQSSGEGSSRFSTKERICEGRHHLKCERVAGVGMYSMYYHKTEQKTFIHYYDSMSKTWRVLRHLKDITYDGHPDYIICTEENIYFLTCVFFHVLAKLHLETLQFTENREIDRCPLDAGVALVDDEVYLFGNDFCSSNIYCFHLENGVCTTISEMTEGRRCPSAVHSEGLIYVTGGCQRKSALCSAERYDLLTQQSTRISSMHVSRFGHSSAAVDSKIYVCGGYNHDASLVKTPLRDGEVYDPRTDCWSPIKRMICLSGQISLFKYNTLCALGAPTESTISIEMYDSKEDEWECGTSESYDSQVSELLAAVATDSASRLNDVSFELDRDSDDDVYENHSSNEGSDAHDYNL